MIYYGMGDDVTEMQMNGCSTLGEVSIIMHLCKWIIYAITFEYMSHHNIPTMQ